MIKLNTLRLKIATLHAFGGLFVMLLTASFVHAQPVHLIQSQTLPFFQDVEIEESAQSVIEDFQGWDVEGGGEDQAASAGYSPHLPLDPSASAPSTDRSLDNEVLDVLARGPLHEAFAAAHQSNPEPSIVVNKPAPENIEELPPEFKPQGDNVVWIPGYWAWDDSKTDFIWISGVWRNVPPGRKWVPGYWDQVEDGHRWVSGFWAEETSQEIAYLPEPPASLDQGPSIASPGDSHFYVPGNWHFQNDRYQWRSGHWQPVVKNWIWVPSRYVWTPSGCIYQSGYWDYEIADRGTCFAPVHFQKPVYQAYNYSYRPSIAITLDIDFLTHLFVRPKSGHYYYGDWYSKSYVSSGYRPWVSYSSHLRHYDPLLAYYGCQRSRYNSGYNVVQYLAKQHAFYSTNRYYRPRTTYVAQIAFANSAIGINGHGKAKSRSYVRSYADVVRNRSKNQILSTKDLVRQRNGFEKVRAQQLVQQKNRIDKVLKLQRERQRVEVKTASRDIQRQVRETRHLELDPVNPKLAKVRDRSKLDKYRNPQQRSPRDVQRESQQAANRAREQAQRKQADARRQREQDQRKQADIARRQREQVQRKQTDVAKRQREQQRLAQQKAKTNQQRIDQQRRAQESARRAAEQQRRKQQATQRAVQQQKARTNRSRQLRAQQDAARRASAAKQRQRQAQRTKQRTSSTRNKKKK